MRGQGFTGEPANTLSSIERWVRSVDGSTIASLGFSFAGSVDSELTVVEWPNRPEWCGFSLASWSRSVAASVRVQDDGVCSALGEEHFGTARGLRCFLCVTFGTGIGSALRLPQDDCNLPARGIALGHFAMPGCNWHCGCGGFGCIQALYRSPGGVAKSASLLASLLHSLTRFLALEAVVLTGGRLAKDVPFRDCLLGELRQLGCPVRVSGAPDDSALLGAVYLAQRCAS